MSKNKKWVNNMMDGRENEDAENMSPSFRTCGNSRYPMEPCPKIMFHLLV